MTRIGRHGSVRTFGKRNPLGERSLPFSAELAPARSFGARAPYVVRVHVQGAEAAASDGVSANIVAVVGVAAVLLAAAPSNSQAAGASQGAANDPAIVEVIEPDSSGMDVPQAAAIDDVDMPAVESVNGMDVPGPAAISDDAGAIGRDLYLEVFINDVSTGLAGNFRETPDGGLACEVAELTEVGIKPVESAIGADGWVRVDQLPGVEYRVDEENQRLYVTMGLDGRATREIDLGPKSVEERMQPTSGWGGVFNYSLYATTNNLTSEDDEEMFKGVSGDFETRIFSPFGTLNQSFSAGISDGDFTDIVRQSTTWSYSDVKRMMTYNAGDIVSGGLSWTRPVYLGGFQARRNFSLRSDLVTMPLPTFRGTAAVPSTLEIYTQNTKAYSQPIGEGPFEVNNLPIYSGGGEARIVLRDEFGRETEATMPFYSSSDMLAKGLIDFSAEVGAPRRNSGVESFDYDERVYGVATARYGLTDWLTLEAHAEGGEDLVNGGVGAVFPLLQFGVGSVAVAGSRHDDEIGALINATAELSYNDWTFFGRVQRTFGDYHDIASVTADPDATYPELGGAEIFSAQAPKAIEQVAISVPLPLDLPNLNLSYTHIEDAGGEESQVVGVSYSQQVFKNVSAYASAFADLEKEGSFGLFAGLSMPLGADYSASSGVDSSANGMRVNASVSKNERPENGNLSWRIDTSEGETSQRSASAAYRSPWARFEAGVQQSDKDFRATAQVDGAIAVAGGGVFAANRINDAFAVVDVGAPGVDVLYENRPYGKTNRSGKILVTGLNSYQKNMIAIDPKSLPVDAQIPATKEIVMPAGQSGVKVDFGVKTDNDTALINLVDANGTPLEAGLDVKLEGSEEALVVGYDGQVYATGLNNHNTMTVTLDNGQQCRASFGYKPKEGEQQVIDAVPCL